MFNKFNEVIRVKKPILVDVDYLEERAKKRLVSLDRINRWHVNLRGDRLVAYYLTTKNVQVAGYTGKFEDVSPDEAIEMCFLNGDSRLRELGEDSRAKPKSRKISLRMGLAVCPCCGTDLEITGATVQLSVKSEE